MPSRSKRRCGQTGCQALVESGYCPKHAKAKEGYRPSAAARGYDHTWRKFRTAFLNDPDNVMCHDCMKFGTIPPAVATQIHHLIKVKDDATLKLVRSNCMPLCAGCHTRRTMAGE